MNEIPLQQRSTEWRMMRIGVCTTSRFADIMTEPRSKVDKEAR